MSISRLDPPGDWMDYEPDPHDYRPEEALAPAPLEVVALGGLMRAGVPEPNMSDTWLYAGALTSIQSEPGVGKTMCAAWMAVRQMQAGASVAYLDEEGGPELIVERLVALGADPAMVDERFCYIPFPQRKWGVIDQAQLGEALDVYAKRAPLAAGYLDSLPDFLAAAGADEDRAADVTSFMAKLLPAFRNRGAAMVVLDHLKKPERGATKSRYARGSGAKLAKAAATVLLETAKEFDATTSGQLKVWKTKDRRGRLPLPGINHAPLLLDVVVDAGTVRIVESGDQAGAGEAWDGPANCIAAVAGVLSRSPDSEFSANQLIGLAFSEFGSGFRDNTVRDAAARLAADGRALVRTVNRVLLYRWAGGADSVAVALDEDF